MRKRTQKKSCWLAAQKRGECREREEAEGNPCESEEEKVIRGENGRPSGCNYSIVFTPSSGITARWSSVTDLHQGWRSSLLRFFHYVKTTN
ncbi:hypothetical protein QYF36_020788 [Acer negundo]|nr:hypothetical protein QYF36_020788 [Acer negundo]